MTSQARQAGPDAANAVAILSHLNTTMMELQDKSVDPVGLPAQCRSMHN